MLHNCLKYRIFVDVYVICFRGVLWFKLKVYVAVGVKIEGMFFRINAEILLFFLLNNEEREEIFCSKVFI